MIMKLKMIMAFFTQVSAPKGEQYQPDLYFYWHGDIEEDYDMGDYTCLCEICFDINNSEGNIKWKDDKNPFECASVQTGTQSGCFLAPSDYNQYIQTNISNS